MPSPGETAVTGAQGNKAPGDTEETSHHHLASPKRGLLQNICSNCPGNNVQGALTAIAEACSLPWTAKTAILLAFPQNNSRIHSKTLDWLSNAILEYDFAGMETKALVNTPKIAFAAAHSGVQRSAITLLGVIYLYMGDSLRPPPESKEMPLLPQTDAELEKQHGQVPLIPSCANPKPCLEVGGGPRGSQKD